MLTRLPVFVDLMRRRWMLSLACLLGVPAASPAQSWGWFDGPRPSAQAQTAIDLLADAASHGLDPRDYNVPALQDALGRAWQGAPPVPESVAALERALGAAMLRFLQDLHDGRVTPAQISHRFTAAARRPFDAAATLRVALALHDLPLAVRQAAPAAPQYQRLREALARYRSLADQPAWQHDLPPLPRALEPGAAWPGLPLLAERLAALGDLPATEPAARADGRYEGAMIAAVRAFQQRHGLDVDGVIGGATWAALQVRPAQRARQLELSLERMRWTPLLQGPRMIVINIPEFVLRAYDVQGEHIVVKSQMKVIVGKALDTRTPLIGEDMRRIEFKPYWNVPASIARNELVPRLRREPASWAREGFEFVGAHGVDTVLSETKLQAVLAGTLRIRQRPGPRNALGDIKFVFPNRESIYLHHTPSVGLFSRARRDFSHGCIRLEQPLALAAFALQGNAGWTEARIAAAMTQPESSTVQLAAPIPVVIAYGTALVKDGRVHFFDDIYGHDHLLDAALLQRVRPALTPPTP
jgi:murein L,D-transpeptidase YcbB/YkuD